MTDACDVSIIIPVFNKERNLGPLLDSLISLKIPRSEVIVVDDGSTNGSGKIAERKGVRVIRHPYNIENGAAAKCGGGARKCWAKIRHNFPHRTAQWNSSWQSEKSLGVTVQITNCRRYTRGADEAGGVGD
ncbi:MAG: glycosyltransferase [Candidatus Binatia bacterium]|jgi:cellulose synthase/poly-beta-1,6-N-acetylglucosamine synthase-like glycosyltransferase|nr:glycosyltransferase [Candidatus Binatia bacterium]